MDIYLYLKIFTTREEIDDVNYRVATNSLPLETILTCDAKLIPIFGKLGEVELPKGLDDLIKKVVAIEECPTHPLVNPAREDGDYRHGNTLIRVSTFNKGRRRGIYSEFQRIITNAPSIKEAEEVYKLFLKGEIECHKPKW